MDFIEVSNSNFIEITENKVNKAYIYILRCSDGTLYTGYTTDLERRLKKHNSGKASKYTRSRLPVELVYTEEFDSKEAAQSREWHIKQLSRQEKLKIIQKA